MLHSYYNTDLTIFSCLWFFISVKVCRNLSLSNIFAYFFDVNTALSPESCISNSKSSCLAERSSLVLSSVFILSLDRSCVDGTCIFLTYISAYYIIVILDCAFIFLSCNLESIYSGGIYPSLESSSRALTLLLINKVFFFSYSFFASYNISLSKNF